MPDLHPDLAHVAHLLGTWSGRGHGEYPTIDSFDYVETVTFSHVGKPFLRYEQRTRRIESDGSLGAPLHAETGYWRFPVPGRVEAVLSHPTGVTEVEEGSITVRSDGATVIDLASTSVTLTASAKSVTALGRRTIRSRTAWRWRPSVSHCSITWRRPSLGSPTTVRAEHVGLQSSPRRLLGFAP